MNATTITQRNGLILILIVTFLSTKVTSSQGEQEDSFQVLKKPYYLKNDIVYYGRKYSNLTISKHGGLFFGLSDHDEVSDYFEKLPAFSSVNDPPFIAVYHERVITNIGRVDVRHLTTDIKSDRPLMELVNDIRLNLADCPYDWIPKEAIIVTWSKLISRDNYAKYIFNNTNNFMAGLFWDENRTYYLKKYININSTLKEYMSGFNLGKNLGWLKDTQQLPKVPESQEISFNYYRLDIPLKEVHRGSCQRYRLSEKFAHTCHDMPTQSFTPYPNHLSQLGDELVTLQNIPCSDLLRDREVYCNFIHKGPIVKKSSSFQRKYRTKAYAIDNPSKVNFLVCHTPSFLESGQYIMTVTDNTDFSECLLDQKYSSTVIVDSLENSDHFPQISIHQEASTSSLNPRDSFRRNIINFNKLENIRISVSVHDFHFVELSNRLNFSIHSPTTMKTIFSANVYSRDLVTVNQYEIKDEFECLASLEECSQVNFGIASLRDTAYNSTIWSKMIIIINKEETSGSSSNMPKSSQLIMDKESRTSEDSSPSLLSNDTFCNNNQLRTMISDGKKSWFYSLNEINCPCQLVQALNDAVNFYQTNYCPLTLGQRCSQDQVCFDGDFGTVKIKCCYDKSTDQLIHVNELDSKEKRETLQPSVIMSTESGHDQNDDEYPRMRLANEWNSIIWPHYKCCLVDDTQITEEHCERFWLSTSQYVSCKDYVPKRTGIAFGNGHIMPFDLSHSKKCQEDIEDCLTENKYYTLDKIGDYLLITDPMIQIRLLSVMSTKVLRISGVAWRNFNDGSICEINQSDNIGNLHCVCDGLSVYDEYSVDGMKIIKLTGVKHNNIEHQYWIKFQDRNIGMMISTYTMDKETRLIVQVSNQYSKEIRQNDLGLLEIFKGQLNANNNDNNPGRNDKDQSEGDNSMVEEGKSLFKQKIDYRSLQLYMHASDQHNNEISNTQRIRDIKMCQGSEFCLYDQSISQAEGNLTRDISDYLTRMVDLGSRDYDICDLPNLLGISHSISNINRSLGSQIHFHGCELTEYRINLLKTNGIDVSSEMISNGNMEIWLPKNFTGENQVSCMKSIDGSQDWYPHNTVKKWQNICQGDRIVPIKMFNFFGGFAYWMIIILFAFGLIIVILLSALIMGFIKAPFNKKISQKTNTVPCNFGNIPTCFSSSDTSGSNLAVTTNHNPDDRNQSTIRYYTGKYTPYTPNSPVKQTTPYIVPGVIYKGNLTSRPINYSSGSDQTSKQSNQNSLSDMETESFNLWDQDSFNQQQYHTKGQNQSHQDLMYMPSINPTSLSFASNATMLRNQPLVTQSSTMRPKNSSRVYLNGTLNPYSRLASNMRSNHPILYQNPYELFPIKTTTITKTSKNPFYTPGQLVRDIYEQPNPSFPRVSPIPTSPKDYYILNNEKPLYLDSFNQPDTEFYPSKMNQKASLYKKEPWLQNNHNMSVSFDEKQVNSFVKDEDDSLLLADFDVVIDGGKSDSGRKPRKAPIVVCKNTHGLKTTPDSLTNPNNEAV